MLPGKCQRRLYLHSDARKITALQDLVSHHKREPACQSVCQRSRNSKLGTRVCRVLVNLHKHRCKTMKSKQMAQMNVHHIITLLCTLFSLLLFRHRSRYESLHISYLEEIQSSLHRVVCLLQFTKSFSTVRLMNIKSSVPTVYIYFFSEEQHSMQPLFHIIMEYSKLEGTHKDHLVQLLALRRTTSKSYYIYV